VISIAVRPTNDLFRLFTSTEKLGKDASAIELMERVKFPNNQIVHFVSLGLFAGGRGVISTIPAESRVEMSSALFHLFLWLNA